MIITLAVRLWPLWLLLTAPYWAGPVGRLIVSAF